MARQPKPWRRGGGPWYSQVAGEKVWLAEKTATKTEAQAELRRVLAEAKGERTRPAGKGLTAAEVMRLYDAALAAEVEKGERTRGAAQSTQWFLKSAEKAFGKVSAAKLKPGDVLAWADAHENWKVTTRRNALQHVKAGFAHAKTAGHIGANPLAELKPPAGRTREVIPTREQAAAVLAEAKGPFRDYLFALMETGCRPGEVWSVTAEGVDLDQGLWKVRNKTRGKTGEATRLVMLTEAMVDLSRRLCAEHPAGPIFRNNRGKPWDQWTTAKRMTRIRAKLKEKGVEIPEGVVCYSLRHRYATDALVNGVPIATVATLLGHTSTNMVMRHYSHLPEEIKHLREAAQQARPKASL